MSTAQPNTVRLDKWLWAARFFKTRTLATVAVNGGKVHVDDQRVKAAHTVTPGARLRIRKGFIDWEIVVEKVSAQRRGAKEAATLYNELPQSEERRERRLRERRETQRERHLDPGRPSREDRRDLMRLKRL